jgi:hypothetical protein
MTADPASAARPTRILKLIGYWASCAEGQKESGRWPDPRDLIGTWHHDEKQSVIKYLSSGIVFLRYFGNAQCRICDARLGSTEMTDGTWAWPTKLEHYVEDHDVLLPEGFIKSARTTALSTLAALRKELAYRTAASALICNDDAWLDWAAAIIPARPAPDAITLDEANALCARLSHRQWQAYIEERHQRWRLICRSGTEENLIYVEQCRANILLRRLLACRQSDPEALLDREQAQAIAQEFDGAWGAARLVGLSPDRWLIRVDTPDCEWPTKNEIPNAAERAAVIFPSPPLDEPQWRMVLDRIRAEALLREKTLQSQK